MLAGEAVLAVLNGDLDEAVDWVGLTIPRCLAAGQIELVAYGLKVLAMAANDDVRAARLFGAAEGLRDAAGVAIWPSRRQLYEERQATVASSLGATAFDAAWAEGRRLSVEDAVLYALGDGDESGSRAEMLARDGACPFSEMIGNALADFAGSAVRLENATNSLMVSFCPSKVAALATSSAGIPILQANG